ncbi:MAG: hypothetical protein HN704_18270 [Bacteroidetes bacterium]|jgi:hypothetical protein|nr:hypothetical protein [Bacteroidota bacterium]MBT7493549.1 hypothetical protein [Bacteroidota bacterium]
MSFEDLNNWAAQCEIDADKLSYLKLKTDIEVSKYSVLQDYCDFNVWQTVKQAPFLFGKESINFVVKHGAELKRKFTFDEMFDFCEKFRILSMRNEINSFEDFKRYKIKRFH